MERGGSERFFPGRSVRARDALPYDHATHATAGKGVGQFVAFSEIRWVGHSPALRLLIANLLGLRRVLLSNAHSEESFAVPEKVAAAMHDGAVKATETISPSLGILLRVSASLVADASTLSSILGPYASFAIALRGHSFGLPDASRERFSHSSVVQFDKYSHPLLVGALL